MLKEVSSNNRYWRTGDIVFLCFLAVCCFWPVSLSIFSAKNDNITQFLPVRFHVSEALRNWQLPLWSPYMYLGYPIHGDMQGGAWNPVVWFLSVFSRYNVNSLHAEIMIYIMLSGLGMYRLLAAFRFGRTALLTGAGAYVMCGYVSDVAGSNLPFLAAASYVPFVLAYYYHFLQRQSLEYGLKTALAISLLFLSAYPSFFIIILYILFTVFVIALVIKIRKQLPVGTFMLRQLLVLIPALLICAPAIISYLQILPHYQRGSGVKLDEALNNSFDPFCAVSMVFPSVPVNADGLSTDLISRNAYFNFLFLPFLLAWLGGKKRMLLHFALAGFVFFFLFSLGEHTPLRALCYKVLPLMDTFRHPSNARLFVIVTAIIMGGYFFDQYNKKRVPAVSPVTISIITCVLCLLVFIYSIFTTSIGKSLNTFNSLPGDLRMRLKTLFDSLSVNDHLFINSLLQLIFLVTLIAVLYKKKSEKWMRFLFIANSFLFVQLTIPYTLVSRQSPHVINNLLENVPSKFPFPDLNSTIGKNSADSIASVEIIGISSFYNKEIATSNIIYTPTYLSKAASFSKNPVVFKSSMGHPFAYFAGIIQKVPVDTIGKQNTSDQGVLYNNELSQKSPFHDTAGLKLKEFWNNGFRFITETGSSGILCLQQVYLPGWEVYIDGNEMKLYDANIAFMAVQVPAGTHEVLFVYRPRFIPLALMISVVSFILFLIILFKSSKAGVQ